jgi:NADH-quinone oxidoreductase subunit L
VGVPFFSGFLSKDAILIGAWNWAAAGAATTGSWWLYLVPITGFVAVALTAYYMTRQLIFVFLGKFRLGFGESHLRVSPEREASGLMLIPVIILAILALGFFYSLNPFASTPNWLLNGITIQKLNPNQTLVSNNFFKNMLPFESHRVHLFAPLLSVVALLLGALIAWQRFRNKLITNATSYELSALPPANFTNFIFHNFYLDKIYQVVLVKPIQWLAAKVAILDTAVIDYSINTFAKILVVFSKILAWFDRGVVDGLVRGLGITVRLSGNLGRWMQNGKIQSYYLFSLLGLLLLVFYILIF